jgi:hypothetical protein
MTLFLILGAALFVGIILYFAFRNKEEDVMTEPKPEARYSPPRGVPSGYTSTRTYHSDPRRNSTVRPVSQPASNTGNGGGIGLLETVIIADMLTHHDHNVVEEHHNFGGGESGGAGANGDWNDPDKRDNSDNYTDNDNDHSDHDSNDSNDYDSSDSSYDSSDSSSYDSGGSDFGGSND